MKKHYTLNNLTIRKPLQIKTDKDIIEHTHTIIFEHPLNIEEKQKFMRLIENIQKLIDDSIKNNCAINFITDKQVNYTLYQTDMSGNWKDLLFTQLAIFSDEIVEILQHDGNPVFQKK